MGKRICSLASMHPGEKGRIAEVHMTKDIGRRLLDMGFREGVEVECICGSPFGDPVAYFLKGTLVAIRNKDAEKIEIEAEEGRGDGEKQAEQPGHGGNGRNGHL